MTCLIIGVGNLGSRHLQGLLTFNLEPLTIYIVDPSISSLEVAQTREKEIMHEHAVTYFSNIKSLPKLLDFVIVATNSNVRQKVITELLYNHEIRFLILEKVLFPDIIAYQTIQKELLKTKTICYVNHPRRMIKEYQNLKKILKNDTKIFFQAVGSNWGIACNALHYIDLFEYLADSALLSIDCNTLDSNIFESKRKGYIEMSGTIKGVLENGSEFLISSLISDKSHAPTICLMNAEKKILIQESNNSQINIYDAKDNFSLTQIKFSFPFQSKLSGILIEEIVKNGTCSLPTYEEAAHTHKLFISATLTHYNSVTNIYNTSIPIT
ncbi:MAG: Gfo/Idh/MocA family oxidoreductase [Candidatus Levybacteria bacterium]|nr:Gfo/Idh/MocA family oxidoreductase [Candidatus Levybacteria bacterium]